ncbi:helix-turn-helix transcriptional regulator [Salinactinospora qingdaonensis]|uniref:HTH cro/C1-type domain-containing protein n=1 Tax=Salinactinospora qingdaonensis TaxID=702744 RepID=A0ABP7GEP9_9ACTN
MVCRNCGRDRPRCGCIPEGFWQSPEAIAALTRLDMAALIGLLRRYSDLSQSALARLMGLSPGMVSMLESGQTQLTNITKIWSALEALQAPRLVPESVAEAPNVSEENQASSTDDDPTSVLSRLLPPADALEPLAAKTGRRLGASTVEDLTARVHGLRLADDVLAGGDLIQPARRELNTALHLYNHSTHTEEVGQALLSAIAELAQIVGWILSDAGGHTEAERIYRLGLTAARQAGNSTLAGNIAGSLAYQWSNTGQPQQAVELATAALTEAGSHVHPTARALFFDRLAWSHAQAGDAQAAIRALSHAHEALAADASDQAPEWAYWVNDAELKVMDARVYTELRRPLRAVPLLSEALDRYDATHARELALYLSWLAVAYADANEPEQAVAVADHMLTLSADLASDRISQRARVVLDRLVRFSQISEVHNFLERASASSSVRSAES